MVRYHSLVVAKDSLPEELLITASLEDDADVIMGLQHISRPIYGVNSIPNQLKLSMVNRLLRIF